MPGGLAEELRLWAHCVVWWDQVTPNVLSPPFFHFLAQKYNGAHVGLLFF